MTLTAGEPVGQSATRLMTAGRFAAETLLFPKALRIYAERGR
jgi:hypothetical protein